MGVNVSNLYLNPKKLGPSFEEPQILNFQILRTQILLHALDYHFYKMIGIGKCFGQHRLVTTKATLRWEHFSNFEGE